MSDHIASIDEILAALPAVQEAVREEIAARQAKGEAIAGEFDMAVPGMRRSLADLISKPETIMRQEVDSTGSRSAA